MRLHFISNILGQGEQGLEKVLTKINCDLEGRFTKVSSFVEKIYYTFTGLPENPA